MCLKGERLLGEEWLSPNALTRSRPDMSTLRTELLADFLKLTLLSMEKRKSRKNLTLATRTEERAPCSAHALIVQRAVATRCPTDRAPHNRHWQTYQEDIEPYDAVLGHRGSKLALYADVGIAGPISSAASTNGTDDT
jgi:hypothetical protein